MFTFWLIANTYETMPLKSGINRQLTGGLKGKFKRCINGICELVIDLLFENNPFFESNNELGVSFYIKKQKYVGKLSEEYDILATNCTIDSVDPIIEEIDLYNFINDKYDIAYLVLLAAAKITIGILAFFLYKISNQIKSKYHFFTYYFWLT